MLVSYSLHNSLPRTNSETITCQMTKLATEMAPSNANPGFLSRPWPCSSNVILSTKEAVLCYMTHLAAPIAWPKTRTSFSIATSSTPAATASCNINGSSPTVLKQSSTRTSHVDCFQSFFTPMPAHNVEFDQSASPYTYVAIRLHRRVVDKYVFTTIDWPYETIAPFIAKPFYSTTPSSVWLWHYWTNWRET